MKNHRNNNIINEKYTPGIGLFTSWNTDRFTKTVTKILLDVLDEDDIADEFNGVIVPKKWFDWSKVFKGLTAEKIKIKGQGIKGGCKINVEYNYQVKDEEFKLLVFGDDEEEKLGGIIYNPYFRDALIEAGISAPQLPSNSSDDGDSGSDPDSDDSDPDSDDDSDPDSETETESINLKLIKAYHNIINEDSDEDPDGDSDDSGGGKKELNLKVRFRLGVNFQAAVGEQTENLKHRFVINEQDKDKAPAKSMGSPKLKPKDYLNPNYISSFEGKIYFEFNGVDVGHAIAKITAFTKRTKDMNKPPKLDLGAAMKNLWSDTMKKPTDFGLAGVAAKKLVGKAFGAIKDKFTVVQKKDIDIEIESKYNYTDNFKNSEDREKEASIDKDVNVNANEYKSYIEEKLKNSIKEINSSLSVEVISNSDNGKEYVIIINKDNMSLFNLVFRYS